MSNSVNKEKLPKDLRASIALLTAVGVFVIAASVLPQCGIYINTIISTVFGAAVILSV